MFDLSALSTTGMEVTFTKKNGETRVMRCTTNLDKVPSASQPKGTGGNYSAETKRVFDLDKKEWRSFRLDSIISVKAL